MYFKVEKSRTKTELPFEIICKTSGKRVAAARSKAMAIDFAFLLKKQHLAKKKRLSEIELLAFEIIASLARSKPVKMCTKKR